MREMGAQLTGGMTALLFAARDGQMEAAHALLDAGADVNAASAAEKTTPLVMAVSNGHYDLAKYFVEHGADPNLANIQGLTALYGVLDVQWAGHSWFPNPVTAQEKTGYLELMKILLAAHADVNAKLAKKTWFRTLAHDATWVDPAGATAFWRAAQATDLDAMKLLLAAGADPKISTDRRRFASHGRGRRRVGRELQRQCARFLAACRSPVPGAGLGRESGGYSRLHGAARRRLHRQQRSDQSSCREGRESRREGQDRR